MLITKGRIPAGGNLAFYSPHLILGGNVCGNERGRSFISALRDGEKERCLDRVVRWLGMVLSKYIWAFLFFLFIFIAMEVYLSKFCSCAHMAC